MSFVKKAVKKVVKFVKKYWKEIVLVAAIVFTAGIATVGFSAFAGVNTFGGFMGAVGKTMVAGVQGIGATMGIGSGATTAGGAKVGLGAAWGAGGGGGWATGSAAAKIAAANKAAAASGQLATMAPLTKSALQGNIMQKAAATATKKAAGQIGGSMLNAGTTTAATTGSKWTTVGSVLKGVGAVAGPAMTAYASMKQSEAENAPPLASWGVEVGREDEYYEGDEWKYGEGENEQAGVNQMAAQQQALMPPPGPPVGQQALAQQAGQGAGQGAGVAGGQQPLMPLTPMGGVA